MTDKLVPVAAPILGVIRVGLFERTTFPDPVLVVVPVPPLLTGMAVQESVIANVPEFVIGDPVILRKLGTVAETLVTVPVVGVNQVIAEVSPPALVNT